MSNTEKLLDLEKDPNNHLFLSDSNSEPDKVEAISPSIDQVHRSVAALFVEGNSPSRIAAHLGIAAEKVKTLLKRDHTQTVIKELLQQQGPEGVDNILKATEVDTVLKLIEIRDSPNSPPAVQRQVCRDLIELQRGKKPFGKGDEDMAPTGGMLDSKVAEIDKQIKELTKKNL